MAEFWDRHRMLFQFAPIIPVYAVVAALTLFLSIRTWRLRPTHGATAWSMAMLFCAIHAIGSGLEIAFTHPVLKLAMNRVIYLGITGLVFYWGIFAIQYSNYSRWLNRITLALLAFLPLVTMGCVLFNEQHQWLYRAYQFVRVDGLLVGQVVTYGPLFWVWVAYGYCVMIGSWLLLLRSAIQSHAIFRSQIWTVILGSGVPVLAYTLQLLGVNLFAPFSSIPIAMALAGIIMLLAMTQFRFIDIIPVAYDLIFKSVNGGIIVIDLKGRVAGLNRAAEQILGCREKDVLWKQINEAFPNQQQIVRQFWDVMETKTEIAFPERQRHYELQIAPLHSYHGELAGRLIMFYDITERKQIEQKNLELTMERERVRLLKQFINHMSHDLRTPLATMRLAQYLLRKELDDQHSARLDSLDKQTDRLTDMVESMFTLLRLEEESPDNHSAVNVNDIATEVIAQHQPLAHERHAHVHFAPVKELPLVLANYNELSMALSNVLVNAVQYSSGGDITITTQRDNECVVICVCDNGVGIAAEDLPHIFERFYRADDARGTQHGGLGLGLSITKTIIDRHAGTIDVQSHVGQGSKFSIRLPMQKAG